MSLVNDNSEINDIRTQVEFKGITFSNFKKTEVKTQLIQNIKNAKLEPASYWCAELVCAGHYMDIWEIILHYVGKHIHLGNPKLVIYLERRYTIFKNIINQGYHLNELQLRNFENIRKLFAEIICVLSKSHRKHSFEYIKINRIEEFDITQMTERLKAPSTSFIEQIYKPKDPKEFIIPMNEFAYNLSPECRNVTTSCYWIEWMIDFDILCKKRREPCYCEKRNEYNVDNKMKCDIIWMVWDCLFYYCDILDNQYITTIMRSLLELFCIKYTSATSKKRRYLLYFAVALIIEPVPTTIEIVNDKNTIQYVVENINSIYKQIKVNEKSPKTEYLFSNLDKDNNFEKTIEKLEMMNKIENYL
jgi:hypothetical protein